MTRIKVTLWTCGRCRKPRGLHHVCTGHRKGRDQVRLRLSWTCPSCGRQDSPLTHTCRTRSDFRKRKAAEKRREQAEERKRKRRVTAARKRARAKERKRLAAERRKQAAAETAARRKTADRQGSHDKNRHEYETCTDPYCERYACRVYREGIDRGRTEERPPAFEEGFAAGLAAALASQ